MALTIPRWIALFVAGALIIVPLVLREGRAAAPGRTLSARGNLERRVVREEYRLKSAVNRAQEERRVDSVLRVIHGRTGDGTGGVVVGDPSLEKYRPSMESLLELSERAAPTESIGIPTSMVFTRGATQWTTRIVSSPSERCVVIAPVKLEHIAARPGRAADTVPYLRALNDFGRQRVDLRYPEAVATQLRGVCAFYAALGRPGAHVRRWLDAGGRLLVQSAAWGIPPNSTRPSIRHERYWPGSPMGEASLQRLALDSEGRRCIDGVPEACIAALHGPLPQQQSWRWIPNLGMESSPTFLSDLVQRHGADAIGRWWRSDLPLEEGFRAATGRELSEATRDWLLQSHPDGDFGPHLSGVHYGWATTFLALGIIVGMLAAARRQVS